MRSKLRTKANHIFSVCIGAFWSAERAVPEKLVRIVFSKSQIDYKYIYMTVSTKERDRGVVVNAGRYCNVT